MFNCEETVCFSVSRVEPLSGRGEFSVPNHVAMKLSVPVTRVDVIPLHEELCG